MSSGTFENDPEKGVAPEKSSGDSTKAAINDEPQWDSEPTIKEPWSRRFVDSFKRDPNAHVIRAAQGVDATGGHGFDHKGAAERTANSGLAHKLKSRHMQMIAIGGSIGEFDTLIETRC